MTDLLAEMFTWDRLRESLQWAALFFLWLRVREGTHEPR